MSVLAALAAACWVTSLVFLFGSALAAWLQPLALRLCRTTTRKPAVSIVVPVRVEGAALAEASRALSALDYPLFDIAFCAGEKSAAAVDCIRSAMPPNAPSWRLVDTPGQIDVQALNPKVANMATAIVAAEGELLMIKDAETILDRDCLWRMANLMTEGVGLVVAVPIGRDWAGFGGSVDAAFMNGYGARLILAASSLGVGVGLGAAMLTRRADFVRANGLAAMAASIADDHALALAMGRIGLRTRCIDRPVWQTIGRCSLAELWRRHLRWAICRRVEAPAAFRAEPLAGAAAAGLAGALSAPFFGSTPLALLALTFLAWICVELMLAWAKGWPIDPLTPFSTLAREAMLPALWLAALTAREIAWGGRIIVIDRPDRRRA